MPIHDQGYRRYRGTRAAIGSVVAGHGPRRLMSVVTKRVFIGLMLLAWAPFVVRAVQIYVAANFPQASFLAPKGETFREFLDQQGLFVFFVTIYVGAGLIANDRRANALQIYLSKPMTQRRVHRRQARDPVPLPAAVTFLPAMMLLLMQAMFAGSLTFIRNNLYLVPGDHAVFSLAQVLLASTTMLALSSLSKSSRFVAVMYAGLFFFTAALFNALRGITGTQRVCVAVADGGARSSWAT